jgi:hypothetical protein
MSASQTTYRRIVRREMHSPRSATAIALAAVAILLAAWVGTESVLRYLGRPALLVDPVDALDAAVALPATVAVAGLVAAGAVVALVGLALVLVAVLPGRRATHQGRTGRTALVVGNRAIASVLARRAARAAGVGPDQVVVSVARRVAEVRVSRSSGWPVDAKAVADAVELELARLDMAPALRATVVVERHGVVGA